MKFKFASASDSKILLFLTISISAIFAACSSPTTSNNDAIRRQESSANYTSSNSASMSNGSSMSAELIADEKSMRGERYAAIDENPFLETSRAPLSTFSIDVDTASYANVRRYLNDGTLPPKDAVRIEELVNYFEYDYPQPIENASENLKFAFAVAEFGLLVRGSRYKSGANFNDSLLLAQSSLGTDLKNYRRDFLNLVKKAESLRKQTHKKAELSVNIRLYSKLYLENTIFLRALKYPEQAFQLQKA